MKIYYANIDDDINLGLSCISLVDYPAVESNFLCFADQDEHKQVLFKDEAKHIITGCAIRANRPIYRIDEKGNPFYIVFSPETIEKMVERFAYNQLLNIVDLQHNGEKVEGIVMIESYIKNVDRGINPVEFDNIEDKSWFVSYKVTNEKLWNEIVNNNNLNGFSIECMIDLIQKKLVPTQNTHHIEENNFEETKEDTVDDIINKILEEK